MPKPFARRARAVGAAALLSLAACHFDPIGLQLADGWQATSLAVWRHARPDMMVHSRDRRYLFVSCEKRAALDAPSLYIHNRNSGKSVLLLSGLNRADGLKMAPDGSLWLGEESNDGLIWRIAEPDKLPAEQFVQREKQRASHPAIAPLIRAGTFAHEGIAFSRDGAYAYLPDEHPRGALYRYRMRPPHLLQVLDGDLRWRTVSDPTQARAFARTIRAASFNRMEDAEVLPDGRLLIAETDAPRIIAVTDHGDRAEVATYLDDPRVRHPDNLAWDEKRRWLWITDDDKPSRLWRWDGIHLQQVALHRNAEITGVLPVEDGSILINLQGRNDGPELTVRLAEENRE